MTGTHPAATVVVRPSPAGIIGALIGGAIFVGIVYLREGPSSAAGGNPGMLLFVGSLYTVGAIACVLTMLYARLEATPGVMRRRTWTGGWQTFPHEPGQFLLVANRVSGVSQVTQKPVQRLALFSGSGRLLTRITPGFWDAAALARLVATFGEHLVVIDEVQTAAQLHTKHPGSLSFFARHPYLTLLALLIAVLVLIFAVVFAAVPGRS